MSQRIRLSVRHYRPYQYMAQEDFVWLFKKCKVYLSQTITQDISFDPKSCDEKIGCIFLPFISCLKWMMSLGDILCYWSVWLKGHFDETPGDKLLHFQPQGQHWRGHYRALPRAGFIYFFQIDGKTVIERWNRSGWPERSPNSKMFVQFPSHTNLPPLQSARGCEGGAAGRIFSQPCM